MKLEPEFYVKNIFENLPETVSENQLGTLKIYIILKIYPKYSNTFRYPTMFLVGSGPEPKSINSK